MRPHIHVFVDQGAMLSDWHEGDANMLCCNVRIRAPRALDDGCHIYILMYNTKDVERN